MDKHLADRIRIRRFHIGIYTASSKQGVHRYLCTCLFVLANRISFYRNTLYHFRKYIEFKNRFYLRMECKYCRYSFGRKIL